MKKIMLGLAACAIAVGCMAFPKAIYVKEGNTVTKYNFGVAGDLVFSNNGKSLAISGYSEIINLDNVDYISFVAPEETGLTESQQKEKMIGIGEEVYSMIDLNRNADLLNMVHCFFDHFDVNGTRVHPPVEYEVPKEYYDVHDAFRAAMKSVKGLAVGNAASARAFKAKSVDLYRVSDYFGIYYANPADETWHKTASADYLEIRFNDYLGGIYFVRLTASNDFTTWNTKDFNGQMPRKMEIFFGRGNETFATGVITTELVQDTSIDMTFDFVANGYVVKDVMSVNNDLLVDHVYVTIDGKPFVTTHTNVAGKNLVNYDIMFDDIKEAGHYHDEDGECSGDDAGPLVSHFIRATVDGDVIGKLQAKGKAFDIKNSYDILNKDQSPYSRIIVNGYEVYTDGKVLNRNGGVITVTYEDIDVIESKVQQLNDFTDASFYYDGEKKQQGYLTWDISEDEYEYYPDNTHYGYAVKDGFLIYVSQQWIGNDDEGRDIWSDDYYYYASRYTDENGYEGIYVPVPASAVIFPELILDKSYELMPLFTFPDMTTFAFEDFFDEDTFKGLIDDYNDVIDTYLKITGQEED